MLELVKTLLTLVLIVILVYMVGSAAIGPEWDTKCSVIWENFVLPSLPYADKIKDINQKKTIKTPSITSKQVVFS